MNKHLYTQIMIHPNKQSTTKKERQAKKRTRNALVTKWIPFQTHKKKEPREPEPCPHWARTSSESGKMPAVSGFRPEHNNLLICMVYVAFCWSGIRVRFDFETAAVIVWYCYYSYHTWGYVVLKLLLATVARVTTVQISVRMPRLWSRFLMLSMWPFMYSPVRKRRRNGLAC